jgi:tRNA(fMet)-specific endonuclease VapC
MDAALIDTDILSEVIKGKHPQVLASAQTYLAVHQRLSFSAMTVYEVLRGMLASQASRQLAGFLAMVGSSDVRPVTLPVLVRAAELWAEARNNGYPCNDADLIIAATALESQRVLVTGNTAHFAWITELQQSDWRSAVP